MTTYAGVNSFPAQITLVDDGVPDDGADFNVSTEGLADRTVYLKGQVDTATANIATLTTGLATEVSNFSGLHTKVFNNTGRMVLIDYLFGSGSSLATLTGPGTHVSTVALFSAQNDVAGDAVEVCLSGEFQFVNNFDTSVVVIKLTVAQNGGGPTDIPNATLSIGFDVDAPDTFKLSFVVRGAFLTSANGSFDIAAVITQTAPSGADVFTAGHFTKTLNQYRVAA